MRAMPADGEPVLIVGAGIIGLAALAAVRGLFPRSAVTVLARHAHQGAAAAACGADHVVMQRSRPRPLGGAGVALAEPGSSAASVTRCSWAGSPTSWRRWARPSP